jgi:hypothetical protein
MPLLELEKAGLDSLLLKEIKEAESVAAKYEQEYVVEGQHRNFYDRVRGELYRARGIVEGLMKAQRLMGKYL